MDGFERVTHVKAQLQRVGGKKSIRNDYSMIQCPFHNDGTPSGKVRHTGIRPGGVGRFKCFACGKEADWTELAERLNLEPFPNTKSASVPKFNVNAYDAELLASPANDTKKETLELTELNAKAVRKLRLSEEEWRGFSFEFLRSVGAKLCMIEESGRYYIYLPVNVNGKVRGYIKALPAKVPGLPGYFNSPGYWSSKYGLFLYDESVALMRKLKLKTIVIVEGPRDALRLYRDGIPVVAILGTQSWSKRKVEWLEESGAEKVILCMDCDPKPANGSDPPGKAAEKLLYSGVRKRDGKDPEVVAPALHTVFKAEAFCLCDYLAKGEDALDPYDAPIAAIEDLRCNLE